MGNYPTKPNLPWLALRHSEVMTLAYVRSWVQSPALKPRKQHPLSPPLFPKRNLTSDFLCPGLLTWTCLFRVLLVAGRFCACLAKEITLSYPQGRIRRLPWNNHVKSLCIFLNISHVSFTGVCICLLWNIYHHFNSFGHSWWLSVKPVLCFWKSLARSEHGLWLAVTERGQWCWHVVCKDQRCCSRASHAQDTP